MLNPFAVTLVAVLWLLVWVRFPDLPGRVEPWLQGRAAPAAAGVVTALAVWWVWGSLSALPVVHDEIAYVLQARIFALGRWAAPSPPMPHFFQQFHVLVEPAVASKYYPGHSLAMAPGAALGLPGLVPVLLSGATGALLFVLARRAAGAWVALLAWVLWLGAPLNLEWHASYMSETTTGALCLLSWWLLLRWRDTGKTVWLVALAAAVGWGAITRPLTMLAFFLPVAVLVLMEVWKRRAWGSAAAAVAAGLAVLALIPLWSAGTTGDWRTSPHTLYTRTYMPWDVPGFGPQLAVAPAPPTPDMASFTPIFLEQHRQHAASRLPAIAFERAKEVGAQAAKWRGLRFPGLRGSEVVAALLFGAFLLIGAAAPSRYVRFAGVTAVLMFAAYLSYAHGSKWAVYYVELLPVLAFATAVGMARVAGWAARRRGPADPARAIARALLLVVGILIPAAAANAQHVHRRWQTRRGYVTRFENALAAAPQPRVLVFARYAPGHSPHNSVIGNVADPARTRALVVYDRGAENVALARLFPDRAPYLWNEQTYSFHPLRMRPRTAPPAAPPAQP